jgi:hypothetical protein
LEIRDLLVTPFVLLLVYIGAYMVRPFVTDELNRKYFIPAFTARVVGALALGCIYQFYYHGGDTYNFHTYGSRIIWQAFMDSPEKGIRLLLANGEYDRETFEYANHIYFYTDHSSYAIIKLAAFFDLFTFSAYSATAVLFAVISFVGSWCLFLTFNSPYSKWNFQLAIAALFMPSVVFWGSGILKDTVSLACISIATYLIKKIFIDGKFSLLKSVVLVLVLYITLKVKMYILLCYIPAAISWVFARKLAGIGSLMLKVMILPFGLVLALILGYVMVVQIGKQDYRYQLENIATTAQVTAYDIAFQTGQDAGSTYAIGELDGTITGLLKLAPKAINVSLFRPYIWEVRNPLMLMTAIESFFIFLIFLYVIFRAMGKISVALSDPTVIFCFVFSLAFAFAVGVSTFNFGTLSRYKIPLIPFFLLGLVIFYQRAKSAKKLDALDTTEYA